MMCYTNVSLCRLYIKKFEVGSYLKMSRGIISLHVNVELFDLNT